MAGETPAPVGGTPTPTPGPNLPAVAQVGNPNSPTPPATPTPPTGETPLTWDGWLAQQPDNIKALVSEHTNGLKTALQSERGTRGNLERQLNDLKRQLTGNDDAQKEVTRIQAQLAEENTRADFYEAVGAAGATNLKRVWTLAKADGLIDDKGRFKLDDVKSAYPEYFTPAKPVVPVGNAGSGTQQPAPALSGNAAVNNWIRSAAGLS